MTSPFGNVGSSGSSPWLFGQPSGLTTAPTSNLFGQNKSGTNGSASGESSKAITSGTSLFGGGGGGGGGGATTTTGFGSAAQVQGSGSTSLFSTTGTGAGGAFGGFGRSDEKKQENPLSGVSSGFATPNKTSNLFGSLGSPQQNLSDTAATPKPTLSQATFSLNNASTTPAGPPPSGTLFNGLGQGQKSVNSLWGSTPKSSQPPLQTASKPASSLFGGGSNISPATTQGGSSALFASAPSVSFEKPSETPKEIPSNSGGPSIFSKSSETSRESQTNVTSTLLDKNTSEAAKEVPKWSFVNTNPTNQKLSTASTSTESSGTSKPGFSLPSLSTSNAQQSISTLSTSTVAERANAFGTTSSAAPATSLFGSSFGQKPGQESAAPSSTSLFANVDQKRDSDGKSAQPPISSSTIEQNKKKENATHTSQAGNASTIATTSTAAETSSAGASSTSLFGSVGRATQQTDTHKTTEAAEGSNPGLGASTAGPAPAPQSRLKNKSMDDIITRWASDLSKYQKEFQSQAETVATWDRMLLDNGNAISKLYSKTFQAERDTTEVQKQLSTVESHQDELSQWLDRYEREVDEMMARQIVQGESLQGPDQERERTYKIAERVSERLDEMGKDLTSMIEEINDASSIISKTSRPDDPLSQIVRILNGHLLQLQLIDQGAAELQAKVNVAQRDSRRLGSRSNGFTNNEAIDQFYKSYMRKG